jgi:hypothetical protein
MSNVVDVPLYLAASDQLSMGTMKRLALALGGVVNVGKKGFLSAMVDGERDFIQFFERSVESNIELTASQMREHLDKRVEHAGFRKRGEPDIWQAVGHQALPADRLQPLSPAAASKASEVLPVVRDTGHPHHDALPERVVLGRVG